jgi:hypothetical protein
MKYTGLLGIIKRQENDYELTTKSSRYFPAFAPSQKDVIELINLYWVDKFKDGDYDNLGVKKSFYNIVESPTLTAAKMIDLDTKDIKIIAENGQSFYPAMLYERELNVWMKSKKNVFGQTFGQFLNNLVINYPKYGHVIVKKAKNSVHIVPLENIIADTKATSILKGRYVIEKHEVNPDQFEYDAEVNGWDNLDEVLYRNQDKETITYYEIHGNVKGETDNYFVIAEGTENGFVLFSTKIDRKKLYKEIKWDSVAGRALGRGVVEKLFEAQIQMNKVANYKSQGLHWTSKHIYQSKDSKINRNLMTNVDNGEILITNSEINPIVNEERNLNAYREEESRWDALIDKRTFAYDTARGERQPAGTTLGATILQAQMASGYFDVKKEDLGMFVKDILFDWIIPEFRKTVNGEHELLLGEFDEANLNVVRDLLIKNRANKKVLEIIGRGGGLPTTQEFEAIKELVGEELKNEKSIKIPANYYDNLEYKIDIIITGEELDLGAKMTTIQTAMQIIGSNPAVLQDKNMRNMFFKLLDLAGLDPTGIIVDEGVQPQQQLPTGGSIAAPIANPQQVTNQTTL